MEYKVINPKNVYLVKKSEEFRNKEKALRIKRKILKKSNRLLRFEHAL